MQEEDFVFETFRVIDAPSVAYYIPNFISDEEESILLRKVENSPKPKWKQLNNRRLQNWGGLPHNKGMIQEKIPSWLDFYLQKLSEYKVFNGNKANHVLINEYLSGQGIMPHVDGPLFYPTIATMSLGSQTLLDFYNPADYDSSKALDNVDFSTSYVGSFLLERKSLVIFKEDMYHKYLHGIKEVKKDDFTSNKILNRKNLSVDLSCQSCERSTRVSLTIRYFPKVLDLKLKMLNQK